MSLCNWDCNWFQQKGETELKGGWVGGEGNPVQYRFSRKGKHLSRGEMPLSAPPPKGNCPYKTNSVNIQMSVLVDKYSFPPHTHTYFSIFLTLSIKNPISHIIQHTLLIFNYSLPFHLCFPLQIREDDERVSHLNEMSSGEKKVPPPTKPKPKPKPTVPPPTKPKPTRPKPDAAMAIDQSEGTSAAHSSYSSPPDHQVSGRIL